MRCASSIATPLPLLSVALAFSHLVSAYIPAIPINDTSVLNLTDSSRIAISWQNPRGNYGGDVSYQLQADVPTNGTTSGALVHFTEERMGANLTTTTPWIAFISCDFNETSASQEWDIFTLARDRGAVSALLYTTTSMSCLLNQHYIQDFEKPLDVFATKTIYVARLIENQFRHTNDTFYYYNGALLNSSYVAPLVNASLANQAVNDTIFLTGTLTARNSTGNASPTNFPGPTSSPESSSGRNGPPASMIVLYVVIGLIGLCFILMLLMGWRRARRHPEVYGRYGVQDDGEGRRGPRTTASGIAQAMLDTFPVIKFRRGGAGAGAGADQNTALDQGDDLPMTRRKRLDSEEDVDLDMGKSAILPMMGADGRIRSSVGTVRTVGTNGSGYGQETKGGEKSMVKSVKTEESGSARSTMYPDARGDGQGQGAGYEWEDDAEKDVWTGVARSDRVRTISGDSRSGFPRPSGSRDHVPIPMPVGGLEESGERERDRDRAAESEGDICPICLLEFEEGDDLRVLPCEREHMYHQTCIDPWLLQVSGSCPLCRKDFNAPPAQSISASTSDIASPDVNPVPVHGSTSNPSIGTGGFTRYLAMVRERTRTRGLGRMGRRRADTTGTMGTTGTGYSVDQLNSGGTGYEGGGAHAIPVSTSGVYRGTSNRGDRVRRVSGVVDASAGGGAGGGGGGGVVDSPTSASTSTPGTGSGGSGGTGGSCAAALAADADEEPRSVVWGDAPVPPAVRAEVRGGGRGGGGGGAGGVRDRDWAGA